MDTFGPGLKEWLATNEKNRMWLASETGLTKRSIDAICAGRVPAAYVKRLIELVMRYYENEKNRNVEKLEPVGLGFSKSELDFLMETAKSQGKSFRDWAEEGLLWLAKEEARGRGKKGADEKRSPGD